MVNMAKHIIKRKEKYGEGYLQMEVKSWCGKKITNPDWAFQDAQHAALSHDGSILACHDCVTELVKCLYQVSEGR